MAYYLTDIFEDKRISKHSKYLYLAMGKYADKDGLCFPSVATLAKIMDVSERQIYRFLPVLENSGWIVKQNRLKGRVKTSNLYRLPWLKKKRPKNDYEKQTERPDFLDMTDGQYLQTGTFNDNEKVEKPIELVLTDKQDILTDSQGGTDWEADKLSPYNYTHNEISPINNDINNGSAHKCAERTIIYNGVLSEEKTLPPLKIKTELLIFCEWYRFELYKKLKGEYTFEDDIKQCMSILDRVVKNVNPAKEKILKEQAQKYIRSADDCSLSAFCEWLERNAK